MRQTSRVSVRGAGEADGAGSNSKTAGEGWGLTLGFGLAEGLGSSWARPGVMSSRNRQTTDTNSHRLASIMLLSTAISKGISHI